MLHDSDIREPLFDFLEEYYGRVRIIEEKNMGRSRADVVMVTEHDIYGIEIKSDADTYARLDRQVKDYDRYFDYNIVVVGSSHAWHIREHVPEYWGVITVELVGDKYDFYVLRNPEPNTRMCWKNKLEILWRPELAVIQEMNLMPKYKEKSKAFVVDKIIERIPELIQEDTIKKQMSELLFERDYTTIADELAEYRRNKSPAKRQRRTIKHYSRRKKHRGID